MNKWSLFCVSSCYPSLTLPPSYLSSASWQIRGSIRFCAWIILKASLPTPPRFVEKLSSWNPSLVPKSLGTVAVQWGGLSRLLLLEEDRAKKLEGKKVATAKKFSFYCSSYHLHLPADEIKTHILRQDKKKKKKHKTIICPFGPLPSPLVYPVDLYFAFTRSPNGRDTCSSKKIFSSSKVSYVTA